MTTSKELYKDKKDRAPLWDVLKPIIRELNHVPACIRSLHISDVDILVLNKGRAIVGRDPVKGPMDYDTFIGHLAVVLEDIGKMELGETWKPEAQRDEIKLLSIIKKAAQDKKTEKRKPRPIKRRSE